MEYGPHPPPGKTGAKYIIREDGQRLDLRFLKKSSDRHLELGYKAWIHHNDTCISNEPRSHCFMLLDQQGLQFSVWM